MPEIVPVVRIEQVSGSQRRGVILKGRSLPYQGLPLGIEIRTKQTWLPANPVATQQVLGSMLPNTIVTGMWKDRYLLQGDNAVALVNFPQINAAVSQDSVSVGGSFDTLNTFPAAQDARLATIAVDAITLMASEQQKVRFQWGQYVRYGLIKRFTPNWIRLTDVEWALEFEWSGVTEFSPIKRTTEYNALTTAEGLVQLLSRLASILADLLRLRQPNKFIRRATAAVAAIGGLVTAVIDGLRSIVSLATAPFDLLATIQGQLARIRLAARAFLDSLAVFRSARGEAAVVGDPSDVARAGYTEQALRERFQEIAAFARAQQRLLEVFSGEEILATFFADSLTSLRDVATTYYGEPTEWTRISNFNGFFSDVVSAGTLIRVPASG